MLLDLHNRFCEIHIPRTGGLARARAVVPWLSSHVLIDLIDRHRTAYDLRRLIGAELWGTLYRFAVLRDPRDVIGSDYRLTVANVALLEKHPERLAFKWRVRVERLARQPGLAQFVRREWFPAIRPGGGLWAHYCQGTPGEDLGVEMIPYPELAARWPAICERVGLKHPHPRGRADRSPPLVRGCDAFPCPICYLPEVNAAPGPPVEWPSALAAEVDRHFAGDLRRLGLHERLRAAEATPPCPPACGVKRPPDSPDPPRPD